MLLAFRCAALGDINGDGITDLAAGAFLDDFGGYTVRTPIAAPFTSCC